MYIQKTFSPLIMIYNFDTNSLHLININHINHSRRLDIEEIDLIQMSYIK